MKYLLAPVMAALAITGLPARQATGFSCLTPPTVSSTLPSDTVLTDQDNFNCFAWQEFIALNWKASPTQPGQPDTSALPAVFGEPSASGTPAPSVWETYALDSDIFRPGAAAPTGFGPSAPRLTSAASGKFAQVASQPRAGGYRYFTGRHVLTAVNKATATGADGQPLSEVFQAFTHSWVTAQNRQTTFYEVRVNQDEYDYIVDNVLYDANCQLVAMQSGVGIHLPDGTSGGVGAIEVKAAWIPLTDSKDYARYLTAPALVIDPGSSQPRPVTVGLVGLHIIHKTKKAQQFTWATFEHVNNAPDRGATGGGSFTYFNPSCDPATDPYKCAVNTEPPACTPPACNYAAPTQVVRENPRPAYVTALNTYVQGVITKANPDSVFQYYQLVNVMWPNQNTTITGTPVAPLTDGTAQPPAGQGGLSNTVLETYFQSRADFSPNPSLSQPSCLACHTVAAIAAPASHFAAAKTPAYASDYSFLFSLAAASNPPTHCPQTAPAPGR